MIGTIFVAIWQRVDRSRSRALLALRHGRLAHSETIAADGERFTESAVLLCDRRRNRVDKREGIKAKILEHEARFGGRSAAPRTAHEEKSSIIGQCHRGTEFAVGLRTYLFLQECPRTVEFIEIDSAFGSRAVPRGSNGQMGVPGKCHGGTKPIIWRPVEGIENLLPN